MDVLVALLAGVGARARAVVILVVGVDLCSGEGDAVDSVGLYAVDLCEWKRGRLVKGAKTEREVLGLGILPLGEPQCSCWPADMLV